MGHRIGGRAKLRHGVRAGEGTPLAAARVLSPVGASGPVGRGGAGFGGTGLRTVSENKSRPSWHLSNTRSSSSRQKTIFGTKPLLTKTIFFKPR